MYEWLLTALKQAFREERLLKRSPRGSVHLLRHEAGGQRFVLRRFTGNAEVYRRLLHCTCRNLPAVYEVASQGEENLVLEEYRAPCSRWKRPGASSTRSAGPCGCSTPWGQSTGT